MERENSNRYITHLAVMEKLNDIYNISLQERIVQEYVYDCLVDLGQIAIVRKFFCINFSNNFIPSKELPCDIYDIISVTQQSNYMKKQNTLDSNFSYNKYYVEKPYGHFLDYKFTEQGLFFNIAEGEACIEADFIKVDTDNNILFKEDLLNVLVAYCITKSDYAKFRAGNISPAIYQESMRIYQEEFTKAKSKKFNRNYLDKAVKQLYSFNSNRYFY